MNFIQAIIMGAVQGLSEFLPVSSSAHLVFTSNFYKVFANIPIQEQSTQEIFFDIMVHLGTLVAVLIFFRKDIMNILSALWCAIKNRDWSSQDAKLGLYIMLGTFLTVIIAFPLEKFAGFLVFRPEIVGMLLIFTGVVLFLSEFVSKRFEARKESIDLKTSVLMGLAQGIAALPGFSRSGWTIAAGLFAGVDRVTAARYSFLLSIPIILGASMVYPMIKIDIQEAMTYNWGAILVGTLVSGVVGYLCIKYFMKFLAKFSLRFFGYYCLIVGIITTVFFSLY